MKKVETETMKHNWTLELEMSCLGPFVDDESATEWGRRRERATVESLFAKQNSNSINDFFFVYNITFQHNHSDTTYKTVCVVISFRLDLRNWMYKIQYRFDANKGISHSRHSMQWKIDVNNLEAASPTKWM